MTNVSTDHPAGIPYIELTDEGRKISFRKDCLGELKILRKVNESDWETLIQRTNPPYVDQEAFPRGTKLTYAIELELHNEKKEYELEVRL
ncbi:hypothetical protein [Botryobacter ruber]|uniref:hypothetical protein n=1 Tax=Botryobacter ruber TaxID=2171629 RepID=UPI000E0A2D67|nr:hypothetical protein [Botryobacter ruber]